MEEAVTFEIEKNREASRRKIQERRRAAEAQEQEEIHDVSGESDASIDSPDDLISAKHSGADGKPKRRRTTRAMISPRNHEKAKEIGLRAMIGINELTKKLYQNCTIQDTGTKELDDDKHRLTVNEVQEICLGPFNVVEASERNALLPELVHPSQTNRDRALAEIVATIPTEGRAEALSDRRKVKEAAKNFDNKIRYAGEGLWSLKGLKTKLHHHQVSTNGLYSPRTPLLMIPSGHGCCLDGQSNTTIYVCFTILTLVVSARARKVQKASTWRSSLRHHGIWEDHQRASEYIGWPNAGSNRDKNRNSSCRSESSS